MNSDVSSRPLDGRFIVLGITGSIAAYKALFALVADEKIDCHLEQRGRFLGACAASHYEGLRQRYDRLVAGGASDCRLVTRAEQREEIGSDFYHGGLAFENAGKLHPALFYGGLLAAVRRRNSITLAGGCPATGLSRDGDGILLSPDRHRADRVDHLELMAPRYEERGKSLEFPGWLGGLGDQCHALPPRDRSPILLFVDEDRIRREAEQADHLRVIRRAEQDNLIALVDEACELAMLLGDPSTGAVDDLKSAGTSTFKNLRRYAVRTNDHGCTFVYII